MGGESVTTLPPWPLSSGQKKGGCGQIMANFYTHINCPHCYDKRSKNDPCVLGIEDCLACLLL